jgi:DUF4097 and DUF4098 domain-containing protein YvlB
VKRSNQHIGRVAIFAAAILAAGWLAGCGPQSSASGSADRTFTVSGPVRLELANGSGDSRVSVGPAGEVRVHAEFSVHAWPWESAQRRASEMETNPPISQEVNLIRVGRPGLGLSNMEVDYTITVPADTQMKGVAGSGDLEVNGIAGPLSFVVGSGNISATAIADDARVTVGSGNMTLAGVQGQIEVTAGSGHVEIRGAKGEVLVRDGSGDVRIEQPGANVTATSGSGDIDVKDATADVQLRTGSGDITLNGNPGSANYWNIRTGSGDVKLRVPSGVSFRFYGRSSSGDIDVGVPAVLDGGAGKHEVRARIGDAKASVEVQTASGDISLH